MAASVSTVITVRGLEQDKGVKQDKAVRTLSELSQ
jgi:hypothetical protein